MKKLLFFVVLLTTLLLLGAPVAECHRRRRRRRRFVALCKCPPPLNTGGSDWRCLRNRCRYWDQFDRMPARLIWPLSSEAQSYEHYEICLNNDCGHTVQDLTDQLIALREVTRKLIVQGCHVISSTANSMEYHTLIVLSTTIPITLTAEDPESHVFSISSTATLTVLADGRFESVHSQTDITSHSDWNILQGISSGSSAHTVGGSLLDLYADDIEEGDGDDTYIDLNGDNYDGDGDEYDDDYGSFSAQSRKKVPMTSSNSNGSLLEMVASNEILLGLAIVSMMFFVVFLLCAGLFSCIRLSLFAVREILPHEMKINSSERSQLKGSYQHVNTIASSTGISVEE